MNLGLGIDTGGTYTDAVVYDFESGAPLAWGKAPTTRENLALGIGAAMDTLPADRLKEVERVALSTTLATNACVEGRGGRARLVLIGFQERAVTAVGAEYGLPPRDEMILLEGGHDRQGQPAAEPDWASLEAAIRTEDDRWDAYAVVELWGTRNRAVEAKAKACLTQWTGKPVVAGHEITGELNAMKRAASALLNARLLPVIAEFLQAVENVLHRRGMDCPVAIVRGDGTLMTRDFAAARPIETLLCGPASSVLGGARLSGCRDGIIVDMGGTTSDIAMIRDGLPLMAEGGAAVGGWRTGIASIDIETVGLGGDSQVRLDGESHDGLAIGPRRVIPLVTMAQRYPSVARALQVIREKKQRHSISLAEFFVRQGQAGDLSEIRRALWDALADGPLSAQELAQRAGISLYHLDRELEPMEDQGWIMRSALTPTDALHALGRMRLWPAGAAEDGLAVMALNIGQSPETLARRIVEGVSRRLHGAIARMLLRRRWPKAMERPLAQQMELWIEDAFLRRREAAAFDGAGDFLQNRVVSRVPLIGVGAPVGYFLPEAALAMNCEGRTDPLSPVANALGAIIAGVTAQITLTVKPDPTAGGPGGYHVYGAEEKPWFAGYDEAMEWAQRTGDTLARARAAAMGAGQVSVTRQIREHVGHVNPAEDDPQRQNPEEDGILLETEVIIRAEGPMDWARLGEISP